ncbi:hypothetical protein [Marinobacter sp. AN1]|uniref:hypothetical protein n=1 Tax=Marinobacter sp. AN1 TaxID=2886046 RepID=UPI0039B6F4ED
MRPVHQKAAFAHIENAFDHFHVAQVLTRTLDATRKLIWWSRVTRCTRRSTKADITGYAIVRALRGRRFSKSGPCWMLSKTPAWCGT